MNSGAMLPLLSLSPLKLLQRLLLSLYCLWNGKDIPNFWIRFPHQTPPARDG
jgi:hypothetical protein